MPHIGELYIRVLGFGSRIPRVKSYIPWCRNPSLRVQTLRVESFVNYWLAVKFRGLVLREFSLSCYIFVKARLITISIYTHYGNLNYVPEQQPGLWDSDP